MGVGKKLPKKYFILTQNVLLFLQYELVRLDQSLLYVFGILHLQSWAMRT